MWPDIGAVARTLSQLQEVGFELAATAGHRSRGGAHDFYHFEVYLAW